MPRPLRILLVNHSGDISGAENSMLAFLRSADRSRFDLSVACPASGSLADALTDLNIPVLPVDFGRPRRRLSRDLLSQGLHVLRASDRLFHLVRVFRPGLVDANTTVAALHARLALRGSGLPLLWHVRDLTPTGFIGKLIRRRADAVVAISQAVADTFEPIDRDDGKLHVIHNGIDADWFKPLTNAAELRSRFNLPDDAKLVTVVAQITPWKGHGCLLSAWARLHRRMPGSILLVVGSALWPEDRPWETHLKRMADRLALTGSVRFLGRRDDVASIINASVALVVPSVAEPFGRVALEAMALGKPVIGTDAGGLPEVVADESTGLLVEPQAPLALADAIEKVLCDDELADRLGRAGAVRVRECFDIARTATRTQDIYDHLLSQQRGH